MIGIDVARRIRDADQDSKVLRDIPSKLHWNFDSVASVMTRDFGEARHHRKQNSYRVERDLPRRPPAWDCKGLNKLNQHLESDVGEWKRNNHRSSLPTIDGSSITLDFLDWIDCLQDYFDAMKPPDALKCKLAASKLKGEALEWWKELQQHRFEEGMNLITSWPRMYKILVDKFLHTSRLTYFYKQENGSDGKHAKCSTKCPEQVYMNGQENENHMKHRKAESLVPIKCLRKCSLEVDVCSKVSKQNISEVHVQQIDGHSKEMSPTYSVIELPLPRSTDTIKDEDQLQEAAETTVVTHLKPKSSCLDTIVHLDTTNLQPKQITLLAGSSILNSEFDQTPMKGLQIRVNYSTPTIMNHVVIPTESVEQIESEKVDKLSRMTPEATAFSMYDHQSAMEYVRPYVAQRCKLVAVEGVHNKVDRFWVSLHWLIAMGGEILLKNFDPGGKPVVDGVELSGHHVNEVQVPSDLMTKIADLSSVEAQKQKLLFTHVMEVISNLLARGFKVYLNYMRPRTQKEYGFRYQRYGRSASLVYGSTSSLCLYLGIRMLPTDRKIEPLACDRHERLVVECIEELSSWPLLGESNFTDCEPRTLQALVKLPNQLVAVKERRHVSIDAPILLHKINRYLTVLKARNSELAAEAWNNRRSHHRACLIALSVVMEFFVDGNRTMTSLSFGKVMKFIFIAHIVSFSFDPGGVRTKMLVDYMVEKCISQAVRREPVEAQFNVSQFSSITCNLFVSNMVIVTEYIGLWIDKRAIVKRLLNHLTVRKVLTANLDYALLHYENNHIEPLFYIHRRIFIHWACLLDQLLLTFENPSHLNKCGLGAWAMNDPALQQISLRLFVHQVVSNRQIVVVVCLRVMPSIAILAVGGMITYVFDPGGCWSFQLDDVIISQLLYPGYRCLGMIRDLICEQWDAGLHLIRVRVIREGWNDENLRNFISFFPRLGILWDNGLIRETSKLFHCVVNGLDPPMLHVGTCDAYAATYPVSKTFSGAELTHSHSQIQLEDEFVVLGGDRDDVIRKHSGGHLCHFGLFMSLGI